MRMRLPAALAAATAIALLGTGPAAARPLAPAYHGREVFTFVISSPSQLHARVTASGAFRATGHYVRRTATIVFPSGRIRIRRVPRGETITGPDPSTCRFTIRQVGDFRVVRATGRYRGLREAGTYRTMIRGRLRKTGPVRCSARLAAFHELSYLVGVVR